MQRRRAPDGEKTLAQWCSSYQSSGEELNQGLPENQGSEEEKREEKLGGPETAPDDARPPPPTHLEKARGRARCGCGRARGDGDPPSSSRQTRPCPATVPSRWPNLLPTTHTLWLCRRAQDHILGRHAAVPVPAASLTTACHLAPASSTLPLLLHHILYPTMMPDPLQQEMRLTSSLCTHHVRGTTVGWRVAHGLCRRQNCVAIDRCLDAADAERRRRPAHFFIQPASLPPPLSIRIFTMYT